MIFSLSPPTEPPQEVVSNGVGGVSEGGLIQTLEGGVVTKRSSRIAGLSRKDPTGINESKCVRCAAYSDHNLSSVGRFSESPQKTLSDSTQF